MIERIGGVIILNNGFIGNFFDFIINRAGFVSAIIILVFSLYLLKFKANQISKLQKTGVLIVMVGAICILGVFVYLIIGFGKPPSHIPIPIEKP